MSEKQTIRFIINPFSGANNKAKIPVLIDEYLDKSKFEYTIHNTESAGHATVLASQAVKDKIDIVVACGGDGTVNEVAKALVNQPTTLGIVPSVLEMDLQCTSVWVEMLKKQFRLLILPRKTIDSCKVNDVFFLNLAGVGFDALIAYKAHQGEKRGFKMYFKLVTQEIFSFKANNFTVKIDDETTNGEFTTVAVANAAMYGYNFTVAPLAEMTDGLFDVVFIKEASIFRTLLSSWRMLNNTLHKSRLVDVRKGKKVSIETLGEYYYHIDGESDKFTNTLNFELLPKSIKVLFPG